MPEGELKHYADGDKQPKTDYEANAVADCGSGEERQKYPVSVCDESHSYFPVLASWA
jgi:hypothetical protein